MAQPDKPSPSERSSHHRYRQSKAWKILAHLWNEWRVEIFIVVVVAFAIFLLVEQMQIRDTLLGWLRQGVQGLKSFGGGILQGLLDFVQSTTLSDLTGYVLLLIASAFVVWRARWRLMTLPRFTARECPCCGSEVQRIHRRPVDRLVNLLVPVARYRCKSRDCRWRGLRVKKARHE